MFGCVDECDLTLVIILLSYSARVYVIVLILPMQRVDTAGDNKDRTEHRRTDLSRTEKELAVLELVEEGGWGS